ncbi:MAG: hypothetical protein AAF383_18290 [Cyanobacteria bacterium P01_A01_bin.83]
MSNTIIVPGIKFFIFGILLGITQWIILHYYIDWAYRWGLVNIIGGFLSSFLLIFASVLIYFKFLFTFSISIGSAPPASKQNINTAKIITAILSIIIGVLFGLYQSYILPIKFGYINYCMALFNGIVGLLIAIPQVNDDNFTNSLKSNRFIYSVAVALLGGIYSYWQGSIFGEFF